MTSKTTRRDELKKMQAQQAREEKIAKLVKWGLIGLGVLALVAFMIMAVQGAAKKTEPIDSSVTTPAFLTSDRSWRILEDGAADTKADDSAKDGKTRVQVIFDPMCPGCGAFDRAMNETLLDLVKRGEIDLFVSPVSFLDSTSSDDYSTRAVNAVSTIASESPEHLSAFITAIFEKQPSEGNEYVSVSNADLIATAVSVGVPEDKAAKINDESYREWIEKHSKLTMRRQDLFASGFSTPAVFIGGSIDANGKVSDVTRVKFSPNEGILETFLRVYNEVRAK